MRHRHPWGFPRKASSFFPRQNHLNAGLIHLDYRPLPDFSDHQFLKGTQLFVEGQMVGELISEDNRQGRGGSDAARKKSRLPDR